MIYQARTDFNVANTPAPPALPSQNSVALDPDFGTRILRATDANTLHGAYLSVGSAGGQCVWNKDSTMFWANTSGGANVVFQFDPVNFQVGRSLVIPSGPLCWSKVNPQVLYSVAKGVLVEYTLLPDLSGYSLGTVFDFNTVLSPIKWNSEFMVSADDSVFGVGFSTVGGQGTGFNACSYTRDRGVRILNTQTGQITGWGVTGQSNLASFFTFHEETMSKLGDYIILSPNGDSTHVYFWNLLTLNVSIVGPGELEGGHPAVGFLHWMNPGTFEGADLRLYTDLAQPQVVVTPPKGIQIPLDGHASWHNCDTLDTQPFCQITTNVPTPLGPYTTAWVNEILLMDPITGLVYREGHTFASGSSPLFSAQYGIGSISQDGRFVAIASDWMGSISRLSDVFIYELR